MSFPKAGGGPATAAWAIVGFLTGLLDIALLAPELLPDSLGVFVIGVPFGLTLAWAIVSAGEVSARRNLLPLPILYILAALGSTGAYFAAVAAGSWGHGEGFGYLAYSSTAGMTGAVLLILLVHVLAKVHRFSMSWVLTVTAAGGLAGTLLDLGDGWLYPLWQAAVLAALVRFPKPEPAADSPAEPARRPAVASMT